MKRGTRSSLYALVAAFLLFTAYDLFKTRDDIETTMTPTVRIIFIVFFAVAGLVLIGYAWWNWKQDDKEEESEEDKKSFK